MYLCVGQFLNCALMKVIVIGGSGYIGRNIAQLIDAEKVTYYSRNKSSELDNKGVEWIQGDVLDAEKIMESVKDYDMVVDAAGIDDETEQKFFDVHVNGVKNIVAALEKYDTNQRLVYLSTINTHYGATDYFRSKGIGEDNAAILKNHLNVRPSLVFGNGDRFTEKLFRLTEKKLSRLPSGGSLSPVHVEDLVRVIEGAKDLNGSVDVCSRGVLSFADAINLAYEKKGIGARSVVDGKGARNSAIEALNSADVFTADEIERYLMNYSRENTYLDRYVKEPLSFREYVKNYKQE